MSLLVLLKSSSLEQHLNKILNINEPIIFSSSLSKIDNINNISIVLIHVSSFGKETELILSKLKLLGVSSIGIATDSPSLEEMLFLSNLGARAYFNSYMAEIHYQQMLQFVADGQHWYLPALLESALRVANDVVTPQASAAEALKSLTRREKDVTGWVS